MTSEDLIRALLSGRNRPVITKAGDECRSACTSAGNNPVPVPLPAHVLHAGLDDDDDVDDESRTAVTGDRPDQQVKASLSFLPSPFFFPSPRV